MSARAEAGQVAAVGGSALLRAEQRRFRGAACSQVGPFFRWNTDNVVLRDFQSGNEQGILVAVCVGNYKDEACAFASAAAALALVEAFDSRLISEADIGPTLRRAVLHANDAIADISSEPLGDGPAETFLGPRKSLRGIGAALTAVAAVEGRMWIAHIGDSKAYVIRDGTARKLTVEHTLLYSPEYRRKLGSLGGVDADFAASVTLRALGFGPDPQMDLLRMDLTPGDRIVLGAEWLTGEIVAEAASPEAQALDVACDTLSKALSARPVPVTYGVIDVKSTFSEGVYR